MWCLLTDLLQNWALLNQIENFTKKKLHWNFMPAFVDLSNSTKFQNRYLLQELLMSLCWILSVLENNVDTHKKNRQALSNSLELRKKCLRMKNVKHQVEIFSFKKWLIKGHVEILMWNSWVLYPKVWYNN
jgi:hypothetical protein